MTVRAGPKDPKGGLVTAVLRRDQGPSEGLRSGREDTGKDTLD